MGKIWPKPLFKNPQSKGERLGVLLASFPGKGKKVSPPNFPKKKRKNFCLEQKKTKRKPPRPPKHNRGEHRFAPNTLPLQKSGKKFSPSTKTNCLYKKPPFFKSTPP